MSRYDEVYKTEKKLMDALHGEVSCNRNRESKIALFMGNIANQLGLLNMTLAIIADKLTEEENDTDNQEHDG